MLGIYLESVSPISKTAQLCRQIRQKIERGELKGGMRLPPTRKLAQEYGIARNVVIDAYEQLIAEGYLIGQAGSGTYVANGIVPTVSLDELTSKANHNERLETRSTCGENIDFDSGAPDMSNFPRALWAKYLKSAAEDSSGTTFDYGDIRGEVELRTEISDYLYRTRGMRCLPEQIMMVPGSSDGISLIASFMRRHYHSVYLEDPTIDFTRHIFDQYRYRIKPVEVDESGMKLHELDMFMNNHLLLLTPSHQFPTGSILSIQRRQYAVRMAEQADSYIIEDDYDGDFRLKGVPIPPLYSLLPNRVFYVGTFSKTLAPGLRLGFLVLPRHQVQPFVEYREALNHRTPTVPQIALARFIRDGRLDLHIHKMKKIYRNRRSLLIRSLKRYFAEHAVVKGDEAGMYLRVDFPAEMNQVAWHQSNSYGVNVHAVEDYCMVKGLRRQQIVLGYGNVSEENIELGIERLHKFLSSGEKHNILCT